MPKPILTDLKTLERVFANRGIPTDAPGFYNHPAFMAAEQADPRFLEVYAAWVRARPRSAEYDAHVRRVVPIIARAVEAEVASDGQLGVCVDVSMMLTKMLEEEGVWCFAVRGALTVSSPELGDPTHFWLTDTKPVPGHVWVVAPPFEIVDITLRTQPYERNEAELVPAVVALETAVQINPNAEDYLAPQILMQAALQRGSLSHVEVPAEIARAVAAFPSWEVINGDTVLRYAVGGITVSDGPSLHAITSRQWNGRHAGELFDEIVRLALNSAADERPV